MKPSKDDSCFDRYWQRHRWLPFRVSTTGKLFSLYLGIIVCASSLVISVQHETLESWLWSSSHTRSMVNCAKMIIRKLLHPLGEERFGIKQPIERYTLELCY